MPVKVQESERRSLPWLNETCKSAIRAKHAAEGSVHYMTEARKCQDILHVEQLKYRQKLKSKLDNLPRSSKRWWTLANEFLHRKTKVSHFPPLKTIEGAWLRETQEKADALAKAFSFKFVMPPESTEHFFFAAVSDMSGDPLIRTRFVRRELKALRSNQATGPDGISAILLKELACFLDIPIAIICRKIFYQARWPEKWRTHWIHPLFKKGNVYDANNYRGIHLTSIVSKTIECVIGNPLISFIQRKGFSNYQWAFRKRSSSRDLITVCIAKWKLQICEGMKIGLFLADISAAFDRVARNLLLGKLMQCGVPSQYIDFLNAYLQPREGFVIVEGIVSHMIELTDMVFQGTVLGPSLWNCFFADITEDLNQGTHVTHLFADDLTVSAQYPQACSNDVIRHDLQEIQDRAHAWGQRYRVTFAPSKEHVFVIHPRHGDEDTFKMLGVLLDCKFSFKPLIDSLVSRCRPKARAIVRLKHVMSVPQLLGQFKAHIWSFLEYSNGAVINASVTERKRLDAMQQHFLSDIGLDEREAFLDYNFAPLGLRRAIGILGFLHKRVLGQCHPALRELLPFAADYLRVNSKSLAGFSEKVTNWHRLHENSLWNYIYIYNHLPDDIVHIECVKDFQAKLTHIAKWRAQGNDIHWRVAFQSCGDMLNFFHS